ncbi:SUMF1/EgtB/PvdO family nonheme iron enzyme [Magnetospirillum sp. UT-4]|uniref:formylglycine-generating enzyme family protein n=1 Tax=Magnetospirillum sp. UT-4 TaxID=2681467 RepID=UPI00137D4B7C|nr:SUMF1/EgtB/PvdO family nonheme iron enzyme [Magnetospirillum sp. UT-4]CAA7613196.1 conserved exported hypothetical protein [Magnetospirillum sp. UT-4]
MMSVPRLFGNRVYPALIVLLLALPAAAEPRDCPDCPEMVELRGFAIARTEASVGQWRACEAAMACPVKMKLRWPEDAMPMTDVTAAEAEAYAAWLSRRTGKRYRLPTEAEWEFAAKAGTTTAYPWGEAMEPGRAVCQRCDPRFDHRPAPVATMAPNPWGLHDMNGNVWEWTAECWEPACRNRVVRGGSWYFVPFQSRSVARAPQDAKSWSYDVGFRVVRD